MDADVAVVGGGVAGIAAAVQLHRAGVETVLFEAKSIGGLVRNAFRIENLPPFAVPPTGERLAQMLQKMVAAHRLRCLMRRVLKVDVDKGGVTLHTMEGTLRTRYCIFAAGTEPVRLPAEGEIEALEAERLFYEVADVPQQVRKAVVIGGGEIAQDYALSLAAGGADVIIMARGALRGIKALTQRLLQTKRIQVRQETQVVALRTKPDGVEVLYEGAEGKGAEKVEFVVVAIGRKAADAPLRHMKNLRIRRDGSTMLRRLYVAGSFRFSAELRHIAIAAGDGLACACRLLRRLAK